ncbi:MAG: biopolymer transporter ExbB [Halobacteriovoraceae bacterium]|nr:biopolymer transporter ExbB [Halobacteriovoraceae bacterium]MBC97875.1 biopolymer transporter ExbB [Halobacteriovoraceae bacterium]|tara:strand:- start:67689 stop:68207 length:519 start_codon:yes stop_codon:yes gene_type:complete
MKLYEYIQQGGTIMYILVLLNIIGFAMMITKFWLFSKEKSNTSQLAGEIGGRLKEANANKDSQTMIELAKQEIAVYISQVEKGLNTVRIIAGISPLLGLLGTVIGVLLAFQVMAQQGLNDPSFFAKGISMALITTVGGMIVAIPHFVGHNYLMGMLDSLEAKLEKEVLSKIL